MKTVVVIRQRRLNRLGLVTATLLLSLTSTLQLAQTPLNLGVSAHAQTPQNPSIEALLLYQTAFTQLREGRFREALQTFGRVLEIRRAIGDRQGEGTTLNSMGSVYDNLGEYSQALKFYEQALAIRKELGDKAGEGITLNNMGSVYESMEQYPQALKTYEQALMIRKEVGDQDGEGVTLNNMGSLYQSMEQYPQALKSYEQALAIWKEVSDKDGQGKTLSNIGSVYDSLKQYPQALKFYQQALVIAKEAGDNATQGTILNNIGLDYNYLGQYADAQKTLFAAIEIWESLRTGLTDVDKVFIFERQADTYRFLQDSLIAQNKIKTALEIAERGRARAFVELLASRQSSNPNNPLTIKAPTFEQIQQIAREHNSTLVEYSTSGDRRLYIWVIKPTGEMTLKIVDLKSLNKSLEDFVTSSRDSIGVRGGGLGVTARTDAATQVKQLQQLYKLLIEPIAQSLPQDPNARIIFIPQESLFLVPFVALQDESGKYLIEKHTILTAPAIQVLELTHKQRQRLGRQASVPLQGQDALIVGNPTMPSISPIIGQPPQQLPSLPGAEAEAKAIAQLLNTKAITGNQATKASIVHQLPQSRIVHFATHGLLDDFKGQGVPGAIALAPSGNDNGLLTSSEIFDLKLNAELVVLSACDTGRGKITGDGVIGLSRSLITAGVPSIIVSLWSVSDAPTASLMTEFYRQLQQNPDKATALRQAMLTTMKQHPNPKDWAAFTLIGEAE
jgi:CHAT domain-containing protein/Tfp pilus assembly protein PilF